jgi:hypothetical protein
MGRNGLHRNGVANSLQPVIKKEFPMIDESTLRRMAKRKGYRIEKSDDGYRLINDRANVIMYHYKEVTLDEIAKFLTSSDE